MFLAITAFKYKLISKQCLAYQQYQAVSEIWYTEQTDPH